MSDRLVSRTLPQERKAEMSWWDWPFGDDAGLFSFVDREIVAPLYYLICVECGASFGGDDLLVERCQDCRGKRDEEDDG